MSHSEKNGAAPTRLCSFSYSVSCQGTKTENEFEEVYFLKKILTVLVFFE